LGETSGWCEALYHTKAPELILYGRALGLSHGEAEDVLQETFLALMRREEEPALPERYCVRSYRNRALNYRRSLWRRVAREWESRSWFDPRAAEHPEEGRAMRCLAGLPREQREVIVLKIWHEYTFQDIGELLEISPNTAAGRYRYGLERLRRRLKHDEAELELEYERDGRIGSAIALVGASPPVGEP
jgi:RNA polymerase sigma-70 factor (ECF subfamily)